tara:strand:- start:757 stop:1053 length:297 start_codon:yes stop_codon:yes gene_type:complete
MGGTGHDRHGHVEPFDVGGIVRGVGGAQGKSVAHGGPDQGEHVHRGGRIDHAARLARLVDGVDLDVEAQDGAVWEGGGEGVMVVVAVVVVVVRDRGKV